MNGAACVLCGCTEDRACPGGCDWDPDALDAGVLLCDRCAAIPDTLDTMGGPYILLVGDAIAPLPA